MPTATEIQIADDSHREILLPLVRAYHDFEHVSMSDADREAAIAPLLGAESPRGRIWLIRSGGKPVGYVALCFGYSIEFRGRDAFIDELFIEPRARGCGIGSTALRLVVEEARALGIVALHLEVARDNERAKELYRKWGFRAREQFHLMSCDIGVEGHG